ncbi:hypothetical protein B566_EDAN016890 [Ephemera danica]|nr:hypothetical protein B566_EDAN016890 [Ephemera danica]
MYDAQMVCKDGEQLNAVYWTSGVRVETNWLWSSTGVYLDYDNWGPLEPNYQGFPTQACIYFFDGFIHDTSCGDHLPFICEKLPCINA